MFRAVHAYSMIEVIGAIAIAGLLASLVVPHSPLSPTSAAGPPARHDKPSLNTEGEIHTPASTPTESGAKHHPLFSSDFGLPSHVRPGGRQKIDAADRKLDHLAFPEF